ncbi:MAG: pseudouridine synthase [Bdellovibrionota bacterium]
MRRKHPKRRGPTSGAASRADAAHRKSSSDAVRLHKYLSQSGVASRRESEKLILEGVVRVNGRVVSELGTTVNPEEDMVSVRGRTVSPQTKSLYLFFKPLNVVTTMSDPEGRPSLGDYARQLPEKTFPVGRLDFDACGLLLLTNDGDFAERLLHPRYEEPRVYWAQVDGEVRDDTFERLLRGVHLEDGRGAATRVTKISRALFETRIGIRRSPGYCDYLEITVQEGRKHFVKRLLAAVGHSVLRLCRVRYGEFDLGRLRPGDLRKIEFPESRKTGAPKRARK